SMKKASVSGTTRAQKSVGKPETEQVGFRLEQAMLTEIDAYAAGIEKKNAGLKVSRTDAIRMLIRSALDSTSAT
ncbi:MAG TPA: hypothetical protein VF905_02980, partial [Nitrospirota bacterium]